MGAYEATKVVFARLQKLEPNLASNIIGMLLTKENNEMDMIHLAYGPDKLLHSIIAKVRTDLTKKPSSPLASWDFPSVRGEEASFAVNKVGCDGGPRILYRDMGSHEAFFKMNLDEQQQATELHCRCLRRLQLLNLQNRGHHLNSPMGSCVPLGQVDSKDNKDNINGNDNKLNSTVAIREIASTGISIEAKHMVNSREEGKREFGPEAATPNDACAVLESGMEYNLPDSPFSSPTKAHNVAATTHTSSPLGKELLRKH
ncbi:hypothetical protein E2562_021147 [Oryza meyeriana var. granulata]|uniref:AtC3H46-like PABC-like domain-containing protein n=1 Tax=Oryza meyeriana var. granulata TaxID=110450 RepID=A0A6G1BL80_9ORYZ|nr:hypothetical protein E2562_021147 [Oryza meyeriana var. granulata]